MLFGWVLGGSHCRGIWGVLGFCSGCPGVWTPLSGGPGCSIAMGAGGSGGPAVGAEEWVPLRGVLGGSHCSGCRGSGCWGAQRLLQWVLGAGCWGRPAAMGDLGAPWVSAGGSGCWRVGGSHCSGCLGIWGLLQWVQGVGDAAGSLTLGVCPPILPPRRSGQFAASWTGWRRRQNPGRPQRGVRGEDWRGGGSEMGGGLSRIGVGAGRGSGMLGGGGARQAAGLRNGLGAR